MMIVWKGGAGSKAPYETTHVRIPVDIKDQVTEMSNAFKMGKLGEVHHPIPCDEAVEQAKKILKAKKSARLSMQSLLTAIYGKDISL